MRGVMNSWVAISLFVAPSATSCAICPSCGVSWLPCLNGACTRVLAGCAELDACSLREGLHAEVAEEAVRDAQLLAPREVAFSLAFRARVWDTRSVGACRAQIAESVSLRVRGHRLLVRRGQGVVPPYAARNALTPASA